MSDIEFVDEPGEHEASDERIRALVAAHYHAPRGGVPRDAMWAAVRAARQAERGAVVTPLRTIRRSPWMWGGVLAAGLLVGIVADRLVVSRGVSPAVVAARRPATIRHAGPMAPMPSAASPDDGPTAPASSSAVAARAADPSPAAIAAPARPERFAAAPHSATPPDFGAGQTRGGDSAMTGAPDGRGLYRAAAVQTLVQAEALLTAYRRVEPGATQDADAMRLTARWSREVLSSTRLLLDSPAGRDPQLRALLRDLELVLAQIVQLSGQPLQAGERELIERALHDRDLLPRLRSVVPTGAATT